MAGAGSSSSDPDVWKPHSANDGVRNGERGGCTAFLDRRSPALGQMTVNGTTGGASVRPGHFQRPFSPIGRIPSPPALSQQMTALQKNRHAESPDTFAQKSDSPDHETLRATGTGSMDEPGVPTMAKITAERPKNWYKVMFQQIHKVEKQDPPVPVSPVVSHVTPEAKTSWSQSKIKSDSTGGAVTDPCPVLPSAARAPSLTPQKKDSGGDRVMSEIKQLGHPGRKVDTGKYSAEPSKVTQCEPVMASASEEERPVHDSYAGDIDLENEPWYKFFSQLEFGRPPPKKRLDYGAEDSPRGLSVSSLNQSPENRIPEGPASSSCDYWKRLISEPSVGLQSWLMDDQSSRRPGDPQENDSAQRKLSTGPSTPLTSRYQEKDSFRGFLLPTIEQYTLQSRWRMAEREKRLVKALYDFKAQRPRELTFKKGDILYVSRQVNGSWYEGELQGQLGIFPISYVERVRVQEKKPPARPPPPAEMQEMGEAVARYTFVANNNAELSLRKGERVVLLRRVDQNWYEGQIPETGRRGIFPVSYVNVIKKGSTKSLAQCAEPLVTQNYPSSKPASTRPHLNSPSPTPRHHALQSPTPTLAHLQGVNSCGSWISFPAGLSPSSTPAPTPPPFPTNLLPNAALDSRESPTPLSHLPALREGHFIPITSARALRGSPEFSSSPNLAMSSYTSSSPASPMFDCSYGYGGSDVFLGKCADLEDSLSTPLSGDMGVIDAEPSASLKSNVSGDLMANELRQRSTFDEALSFVKSQEEDICEELLSFIQGNQLRRRFTEENRFGTQASDLAEELPKLYIEEEPCENSEDTKACDPLTRARGESAKQEQVTDSLVSPVEPPSSSSPSSQLPALSHPTESKQLPPSPCSTPPLPGITQSSPISSKYSPRLESRSPKIKPALKRDLIIVGKPPRSPVMSRRSCGSPVRGQSFSSSHRRAALVQDALQSGGEPFRVLYNYTPHNEDELELAEGDVVDVMEKCDDGWFVGISRRSKLFGTFPGNYVKRL